MFTFFKKAARIEEFSTNFDSVNVGPFLERLAPLVDSGFGPSEIKSVLGLLAALELDEEKEITFPIRHLAVETTLRIAIFLDDIDAPDIYIFAPAPLRDAIQMEFLKFAKELGL